MEKLRIKIGKKKTVSAMVDEFMIGGTSDLNILKNRDMNNQHPINAIAGLEDALNNRVTNEKLITEVDSALKSAKESGLFNGKDGEDGHTPQKGIDYFDGEPGNDGIGILSIEQESASSTDGGENIIKITLTDGRVQRFIIKNGSGGEVEISQMDVINALGYTPINRDSIVDDLETRVVNLPLSAAQGAKLKDLIDDIKVPTKTSQLTNDSKFMTTDEVVAKINEAISGISGGISFKIVDAVPTGWDEGKTIYLVPSEETDDDNHQYYDEYVFVDGAWEKLGDTRVNLAPYYTEAEVDILIYNVQKSIPTKVSQLYNDAGYITAGDLETGEATWESIKGNILYGIEEFIEWDGNTEGLDTWGSGASIAYRVSDRVIRSEDFSKSGMTVTYENGFSVGIAASAIAPENKGSWYHTWYGVGCVFDSELAGLPEGIYFSAYNFSESGIPRKLGPFIKEKIKPELLPDIMETVGSDTLTWDGNTDGKKIFDLSFMDSSGSVPEGGIVMVKISDSVPTLEELNKGAVLTLLQEYSEDSRDVVELVCDTFKGFEDFAGVYCNDELYNSGGTTVNTTLVCVVTNDTSLPNGVIVEKGIYFTRTDMGAVMGQGLTGIYIHALSVTFNGYNFKKEVIKEEYLPPSIPREGMTVKSKSFADGTELYNWLKANNEKALKYVFYMNGFYESYEPPVDVKQGGEVWFKFSKQRLHDVSSIGETMAFTGIIGETHETYSAFHTGIAWKITGNGTEVVSYGERLEIPNEYLAPANGISCTVYYVD